MRGHEGRVAVVTGADRGLGRAFALRLARDGVDLAVVDLEAPEATASAIRDLGRRAIAVACDVASEDQVAALHDAVEAELGRCDILVNNAGIFPVAAFEDVTFADWRRVLSVNLDALFLTAKAFVPGMRKRRWGRIVNVASALNTTHVLPYIASKTGVAGFTRGLANELGEHGITVNALSPSLVRTPGTSERTMAPGNIPNEQLWDICVAMQAIKRTEEPEDLVGALSFLTSDEAAFVTAHVLYVDGGMVRAVP